jgi:hypothetical protein
MLPSMSFFFSGFIFYYIGVLAVSCNASGRKAKLCNTEKKAHIFLYVWNFNPSQVDFMIFGT